MQASAFIGQGAALQRSGYRVQGAGCNLQRAGCRVQGFVLRRVGAADKQRQQSRKGNAMSQPAVYIGESDERQGRLVTLAYPYQYPHRDCRLRGACAPFPAHR